MCCSLLEMTLCREVWVAMGTPDTSPFASSTTRPGTVFNVQDMTGHRNDEMSSQFPEEKNPTPGNNKADALQCIGAKGPGKVGRALLLPTEPWEGVGRGGSVFLGYRRIKQQMRLVLVALGG